MGNESERPKKTSVVVLYNHVGEDEYEKLKHVDTTKLEFKPEYPIDVATAEEEFGEVVKALRRAGYRARGVNLKNDLRKLERVLKRNRPDVIFNLVEFFHDDAGLEAAVAGMFDLYQIPYTGAPPFTLELCQQKGLTKELLVGAGVPTPRFKILWEPVVPKRFTLHYPLIVKPAWEDASTGVTKDSVIYDEEQLVARLTHVEEQFGGPLLVEEFIEGRELHVAVWGNDEIEVLPPIEFDFSNLPEGYPPIISYAMKWNPLSEVYHRVHTICPAPLEKRVQSKIEKLAIEAYEAAHCRDYARLDIRLDGNKPYVLEVNPNPDLTEGVSFMEAAEVAGHSFEQTLAAIVEMALERRPVAEPAPESAASLAIKVPEALLAEPEQQAVSGEPDAVSREPSAVSRGVEEGSASAEGQR